MFRDLISTLEKKELGLFAVSIFASTLTILSSTALLGLSAFLIAFCGFHPFISEIAVPVVGVRFFGIARGLFRYWERLISHETTFRIIGSIRKKLLFSLGNLEYSEIDQLDKKDVLIKFVDDTETLQDFFLRTFQPVLATLFVGILGTLIFIYTGGLTMGFYFFLPYFGAGIFWPAFVSFFTSKGIRRAADQKIEEKQRMMELFGSYLDISGNSAENQWIQKISEAQNAISHEEKKIAALTSLTNSVNLFLINLGIGGILFYGLLLVEHGELPSLWLPILALMVNPLFEGPQNLVAFYEKYWKSKEAYNRIRLFIKREVTIRNSDSQEKHTDLLSLENVCFAPGGKKILENINLTVSPGKRIAIIGDTGVGKSTLLRIMAGMESVTSGSISRPDSGSAKFGFLNQQVFLFNTSIHNNLLIGNPEATEEDMIRALEVAQGVEFVRDFHEGIHTIVGENGMKLSGGQRQKIGLARVLLGKPDYILLDEVTSGIEESSERSIYEGLFRSFPEAGFVVVTHRKMILDLFDEVYTLKNNGY